MRNGLLLALLFFSIAQLPASGNAQVERAMGWRGDGSGRFPNAQPPTKWSRDSDNIVWRIEAGRGYSSPVLCDGRLFLTAEPSDVVCLDADSGEELWRTAADYEAALGADEAARIAATHAKLQSEKRELGKQYDQLRKTDPDSPQLETLRRLRKESDNRQREFQRKYPAEQRGGAGNAAATVACDGRNVYAVFGTGIIGAFTVAGERLWIRHLEAPQQGFGHSASPLLAGGRLIVHLQQLTALDRQTGKALWKAELPARFGTPVAARIGGEEVLVTPSGTVVLAADGRLLAEKQFRLSNNSPLLHDGVIYAHESGKVKALRLPDSLQSPFALQTLWEAPAARDQRMSSAVYHEGLLYAGGRRGILEVTDAATGESVYTRRLEIGELFSSPTLAGGLIFYGSRKGQTLVLRPGREYDELESNSLEGQSAIPLFAGRRIYLRTDRWLYCIKA